MASARAIAALLLAAGQLAGIAGAVVGHADAAQQLAGVALGLGAVAAAHHALRQRHVVERVAMLEQIEVLEHHAHVGAPAIDVGGGIGQDTPSTVMAPLSMVSRPLSVRSSVLCPSRTGRPPP